MVSLTDAVVLHVLVEVDQVGRSGGDDSRYALAARVGLATDRYALDAGLFEVRADGGAQVRSMQVLAALRTINRGSAKVAISYYGVFAITGCQDRFAYGGFSGETVPAFLDAVTAEPQ